MRSVTKQAVKEARLKEIKQELLNSEKLKVRDDFFFIKTEEGRSVWTRFDCMLVLSLRHTLRTTPEIYSYSGMTKTSILLLSNLTLRMYLSILVSVWLYMNVTLTKIFH